MNFNLPDISILPGCDTIYDVEGFYSNVGVNICPDAVGPHLAVELANSGEGNNTKLDGINLAMGTGVGADVHFSMGKSYPLFKAIIFGDIFYSIGDFFADKERIGRSQIPSQSRLRMNGMGGANPAFAKGKACCN